MPNRILRDGILTSERVNQLDWPAEIFYRRLMSLVDDFGRYDARVPVLRAALYPLCLDRVREADVQRWMAMCQKAGLVRFYEAEGKRCLQLLDFRQKIRAMKSKWPNAPPDASTCAQMPANAVLGADEDEGANDRERLKNEFDRFWEAYPKKAAKGQALRAWNKIKPTPELCERMHQALSVHRTSKKWTKDDGEFIPNPATWLNGLYWENDDAAPRQFDTSLWDKFKQKSPDNPNPEIETVMQ